MKRSVGRGAKFSPFIRPSSVSIDGGGPGGPRLIALLPSEPVGFSSAAILNNSGATAPGQPFAYSYSAIATPISID